MGPSNGASPGTRVDHQKSEISEESHVHSMVNGHDENHEFHSMNALEILRETIRILLFNSCAFMLIGALLICPVSAVLLSNVFIDRSVVKRLNIRLLLVAHSSGLPLKPFVQQSCHKFSEIVILATMCFPLYITLSLLSKAAIVYSVDCTYSRKKVDTWKFFVTIRVLWRRIVSTYLWVCIVIVGCLTLFFVLIVITGSTLSITGISPDLTVYVALMLSLGFSVMFSHAIIICNIAIVISVLEDVSGPQALVRASVLIRSQTQVGILIYLGSTIGMTFVEALFEHRITTLSYGDGSSRVWEGPLLVLIYSFVVLIDYMMSAVFYFSCKYYGMEASEGECHSLY